jgi:hypothetical protein
MGQKMAGDVVVYEGLRCPVSMGGLTDDGVVRDVNVFCTKGLACLIIGRFSFGKPSCGVRKQWGNRMMPQGGGETRSLGKTRDRLISTRLAGTEERSYRGANKPNLDSIFLYPSTAVSIEAVRLGVQTC